MKRSLQSAFAHLALLCALAAGCMGATPPRPTYLPDDWDWRSLCAKARKTVKDCVLVGGDVRLKYEHYFNRSWDPRQGSNGDLEHRELLWADGHFRRVRVFVELEQSAQWGAHPALDPTWTDGLAAPSAYAAFALGGTPSKPAAELYFGRQLLAYGSHRIIDDRDGLNTLQAYDGVRVRIPNGAWTTDVFAVRPVQVSPGSFDDGELAQRALFGAFATRQRGSASFDAYLIGDRRGLQFSWNGAQPESRYTLGAHSAVAGATFDEDTELAYQFGSFGGKPIRAYLIEADVGVRWSDRNAWYRASLGAGVASGNHGANSSARGNFQAPYPTGYTLGILAANGPQNISGFAPGIEWHRGTLAAVAKTYFYFRQSASDGLYTTSSAPLRMPVGHDAAIGALSFLTVSNSFGNRLSGTLSVARYGTGPFLLQSGPAKAVHSVPTTYYASSFDYRF